MSQRSHKEIWLYFAGGLGVFATGVLCTSGAYFILDFDPTKAILIGSILTVTGPTVVGPLLQHIRPLGRVASLARWEGIIVDPIGAVLASGHTLMALVSVSK